jgi:hypothetical protein
LAGALRAVVFLAAALRAGAFFAAAFLAGAFLAAAFLAGAFLAAALRAVLFLGAVMRCASSAAVVDELLHRFDKVDEVHTHSSTRRAGYFLETQNATLLHVVGDVRQHPVDSLTA